MQNHFVTVAICTFRRNELLKKCLQSLASQTTNKSTFSVLVVDNACCDQCKELCSAFDVRYVQEEKTGLSHAKNRAVEEVGSGWIFYLDDDGIAHPNLIEELTKTLVDKDIQIVGGLYHHYFASPPPKWLLSYYSGPSRAMDVDKLSVLPAGKYLSGGILAIRKEVFNTVGGFRADLGMAGERFGYGEEDEFQDRARSFGIPVYFAPTLAMDHLVSPRKYTISSRIKMSYANGRSQQALSNNESFSLLDLSSTFARITVITIPYDTARWLFRPGFYWQNAVVSTATKYANALGRFRGPN